MLISLPHCPIPELISFPTPPSTSLYTADTFYHTVYIRFFVARSYYDMQEINTLFHDEFMISFNSQEKY